MPKILNYPSASFDKSLEVAKATFELGGSCNEETCAEKLGKKVSGGFKAITSAAQKFGLIEYSKGEIEVTADYELIEHAYDDEERGQALTKAFLTPEVFQELYNRFQGKKLPISLLEKMLIREYDVDAKKASRVSKYFTDGLEFLGLIDSGGNLKSNAKTEISIDKNNERVDNISENDGFKDSFNSRQDSSNGNSETNIPKNLNNQIVNKDKFVVHLIGPGMNSTIEINDEDDLIIVNATLNKIKKKIQESEGNI